MNHNPELKQAPLGKQSRYIEQYDPSCLFAINRDSHREQLAISTPLPFEGYDLWNAYELSWLNLQGKPQLAIAQCIIPCHSSHLIESKSFKLYLNSFNQSTFKDANQVQQQLKQDLSHMVHAPVDVRLQSMQEANTERLRQHPGFHCIDHQELTIEEKTTPQASLLQTSDTPATQKLYSDLLKSNCPVTGQPDWGSVYVDYHGPAIDEASLLRYIVAFRQHQAFHEHCVEQIFMDILRQCQAQRLCVFACYTRRGGLDINPLRTNTPCPPYTARLVRQ
jgi:7-cyano-7-deazaguanine reductase